MFTSQAIGNLGADAEVVRENGNVFTKLNIASTRKWKTDKGEERQETTWIDAIISGDEHPLIPYLKQGVKVFVSGPANLRVFSSKKDRCMKAGVTINVRMIELCGGSSDDVPRELINPDDGAIYETKKFYWCGAPTKGMKKDDTKVMFDTKNRQYLMNNQGFVAPLQNQEPASDAVAEKQPTQENAG